MDVPGLVALPVVVPGAGVAELPTDAAPVEPAPVEPAPVLCAIANPLVSINAAASPVMVISLMVISFTGTGDKPLSYLPFPPNSAISRASEATCSRVREVHAPNRAACYSCAGGLPANRSLALHTIGIDC